jgi:hypothetical protein
MDESGINERRALFEQLNVVHHESDYLAITTVVQVAQFGQIAGGGHANPHRPLSANDNSLSSE